MESWKKVVADEWNRRLSERPPADKLFPLIDQSFDSDEILAVVETVLSGQLTMSQKVREFERQFAEFVGSPHAVMVNSGSSANLLAFATLTNFQRQKRLNPGDEVLIPAVCWSTSLWPILQCGLKPIFVDVDPTTLNLDIRALDQALTPNTKALLAVHILGNSAPMELLSSWAKKHHLVLIEDTCESLDSRFHGRALGTIGAMGTYSFYYSHHMTTGEGGMVVCQTQEDYDLLKCLRAHGWSRELSNRAELESANPDLDPRFLFVNTGYNLRPMEVQAALGLCQLKKLKSMNQNRIENRKAIVAALENHPRWQGQFEFTNAAVGTDPVWFGFCALVHPRLAPKKAEFLKMLTANGIENRPIVSGNFVRQPALKNLGLKVRPEDFPGAEEVDRRGFFIGVHTQLLTAKQIGHLTEQLIGCANAAMESV